MFTGGIGIPELLIFGLVAIFLIGVPVAIVILIVKLVKKQDAGRDSESYSPIWKPRINASGTS